MLSGFSNSTVLWLNLPELTPELTGSRESKMTTENPEVLKIQLLYWIAMRFKWLPHVFAVSRCYLV